MAKLRLCGGHTSLDGYVADEEGNFDWAAPDEEVHRFVNDLQRSVGTHLYGRRMYEVLVAWETITSDDEPPVMRGLREDLAGGRQDRVLDDPHGRFKRPDEDRAGLRPRGDPADEAAAERDIIVGGPDLGSPGVARRAGRRMPPVPGTRSLVGGGTQRYPTAPACRSTCSTNAASPAAWCTSTTARGRERRRRRQDP